MFLPVSWVPPPGEVRMYVLLGGAVWRWLGVLHLLVAERWHQVYLWYVCFCCLVWFIVWKWGRFLGLGHCLPVIWAFLHQILRLLFCWLITRGHGAVLGLPCHQESLFLKHLVRRHLFAELSLRYTRLRHSTRNGIEVSYRYSDLLRILIFILNLYRILHATINVQLLMQIIQLPVQLHLVDLAGVHGVLRRHDRIRLSRQPGPLKISISHSWFLSFFAL